MRNSYLFSRNIDWHKFNFLIISFTAELWANSKPHVMKYQGKLYFPLVVDYHPTVFGREDIYVMDYRELEFHEEKGDWAVWPLVQWDPYESNKTVAEYPSPPTKYNIMGTDDRGRDVFTRLLYGLRYTLIFSVGAWLATYIVGIILGIGEITRAFDVQPKPYKAH